MTFLHPRIQSKAFAEYPPTYPINQPCTLPTQPPLLRSPPPPSCARRSNTRPRREPPPTTSQTRTLASTIVLPSAAIAAGAVPMPQTAHSGDRAICYFRHRRAYHRIVFMFISHSTSCNCKLLYPLPRLSTDAGLLVIIYIYSTERNKASSVHTPAVGCKNGEERTMKSYHLYTM